MHPAAFVPHPSLGWEGELSALASHLEGKRIALLTGAGCSTESGIPDYRGEETSRRARNPIQFRDFVRDEGGRRRYWARSVLGWPRFLRAEPNRAHLSLAALEARGLVRGVITQNVDRLHTRAGSRRVVELHGALEEVTCLSCGHVEHRGHLQERLLAANPSWLDREAEIAPDGDAELEGDVLQSFRVLGCERCDGVLKPRVVFFGEGVPRPTVDAAWSIYEESDCLLVVGSSLAVFSGYRFVRRAALEGKPVFLVNVGATRADAVATHRVQGTAGEVLERLTALLG